MTDRIPDDFLQELADRRDIHETLVRLASGIDRNDRECMLSCYHPGALDDHGEFSGPVEQFVEWISMLYRERVQAMSHQLGNHRVVFDSEAARCETYVTVFLAGKPVEGQQVQMVGVGRYLDLFERRDGDWRIARRVVMTDWQQMQMVPAQSDQALVTQLHWGVASTADPVYTHFNAAIKVV